MVVVYPMPQIVFAKDLGQGQSAIVLRDVAGTYFAGVGNLISFGFNHRFGSLGVDDMYAEFKMRWFWYRQIPQDEAERWQDEKGWEHPPIANTKLLEGPE